MTEGESKLGVTTKTNQGSALMTVGQRQIFLNFVKQVRKVINCELTSQWV